MKNYKKNYKMKVVVEYEYEVEAENYGEAKCAAYLKYLDSTDSGEVTYITGHQILEAR